MFVKNANNSSSNTVLISLDKRVYRYFLVYPKNINNNKKKKKKKKQFLRLSTTTITFLDIYDQIMFPS